MTQPSGAPAVAVVGAAGFIGRALTRTLEAAGTGTVGFTREQPPVGEDGRLAPGVRGARAIVWAAASISPAVAESRPDLVEADERAVSSLLEGLRREGSDARVVYLSSGGTVYDTTAPAPFAEDSPCAPVGAYGRSKLAVEQLVRAHPGSVVARVANAYGPGQPSVAGQGVIAHWMRAIRGGEPVVLYGSPDTARDFVYIDDIATALAAVVAAGSPPPVVNVGSGRATTLGELLDAVRSVAGEVEVDQREGRAFDVSRTWLDISLARRELGWEPAVTIEEGVARAWHALDAGAGVPQG